MASSEAEIDEEHIKLIVVGDSSVGKTCLLLSFARGEFPLDHVPTVFDNYSARTKINGLNINLELLDTAGQEEYDRLRPLSYTGVDVVLICYSATSKESITHVESKWVPEIKHFCPGTPFLLVALKTDLREESDNLETCVTKEQGELMAKKLTAEMACETSARTRVGLVNIFENAITCVLKHRHPDMFNDPHANNINSGNSTSNSSGNANANSTGNSNSTADSKSDSKSRNKKRKCTLL